MRRGSLAAGGRARHVGVGILTRRQRSDPHPNTVSQQFVACPEGRTKTWEVTVVQNGGRWSETLEERCLIRRERCAKRGDHVLDTSEREPDDVEIALDQQHRLFLTNGASCLMEIVELLPLVKNVGLRRVQILRLSGTKEASAESYNSPSKIVYGEEQSPAEARDNSAVLALGRQTCLQQHRLFHSEFGHGFQKCVSHRGETEPEHGRGVQRNLAALEVLARTARIRKLQKLPCEPVVADRHCAVQRLVRIRARTFSTLWNHDARSPRRFANRSRVIHTESLHEPGKDV